MPFDASVPDEPAHSSWAAVAVVYGAGLLQGAAFVLVPALGVVFKAAPYHLSAGAYGLLFLPQILGAIISGLLAGWIQRRWGAGGAFRLGLACNVVAAALLAASVLFAGHAAAYILLLVETALLGLGFGLTLAVINDLAAELFPSAGVTAVTVLNALIGGATAFSPLVLRGFDSLGSWWLWPLALSALFLCVALAAWACLRPPPLAVGEAHASRSWKPLLAFAAVVLLYAVVEGTFSTWASLYVGVRGGTLIEGTWALTAFWTAMTALRLALGSVPSRWLPRRYPYLFSPWAMAACLLAIGWCASPPVLVALFAAAGIACGIFYPFSMSFALATYPKAATHVAGILVAALMVGEGIGSYLPGLLQRAWPLGRVYAISVLWCAPLFLLALYGEHRGRHAVTAVKAHPQHRS